MAKDDENNDIEAPNDGKAQQLFDRNEWEE